ncbi:MAG TPA: endo alpha-1,4 polygalactosaminidase [Polyangiaceae bacterium]|nr:endo alpha-1,4 polygalactosaminidase [Polyangiaceae bacterium]
MKATPQRYPRLGLWFELCLACCIAWAGRAEAAPGRAATPRTAFHYGARVPSDLIAAYDQVVVEPEHVKNLAAFRAARALPIAYLSIGEVAKSDARSKQLERGWVLAENGAWSSQVMDLEHPGYQAWLFARYEELWARGYRGFFLDTLDSWRLAAAERRDAGLRRGLVHIIRGLAQRHPEAHLLLNRGFEVLPDVKDVVSGVVAESLFDRWDAATQSYRPVPDADRRWLTGELTRVRERFGLPVTVIDYRPESERPQARETARKIAALGFEPWVTNATLDAIGVGSLEILPRRVLILHDDPRDPKGGAVPDAVRFLAPVLEYLGYVPEPRRIPQNLAELELDEGYQGVITWFGASAPPPGYADWMEAEQRQGLRFVLFGAPGFDVASAHGRALGLSLVAPASASAARPVARDALVGFEAEPPARPFDGPLVALRDAPGNTVHLRLRDAKGQEGVAVATTTWGGFALSHVFALRGLEGERAWVIDPLVFLRRALSLPDAPLPNVTTENGRRLAMLLVRPEGLAALAGHAQPTNAAALGAWLASEHRWPHSVATRPSDAATPIAEADAAAAQGLLELGFFERADLMPGSTRLRGSRLSLTALNGLLSGREVVGPIALDSLFLPSGGPQAYPFRDVLSTLEATDAPRRLAPALIDYHGYLLGSPGGRGALGAILDALERSPAYPSFVSEYVSRARAFADVVVARGLDGSFHYFGGDALRTVRSPLSLGWPLVIGAGGAAVVRRGPDGLYTSFLSSGERELALGADAVRVPHLEQANGRVLAFDAWPGNAAAPEGAAVLAPKQVVVASFELDGHVPLQLELAGLPPNAPCQLVFDGGRERGTSNERGVLALALGVKRTGSARLSCHVNADASQPSSAQSSPLPNARDEQRGERGPSGTSAFRTDPPPDEAGRARRASPTHG